MSESENALPLDESLWDHIEHMDYRIGIPISENRSLNILEILKDIYYINEYDNKEAQFLIIGLAAIIMTARNGNAEHIWQEFAVRESMRNFDKKAMEMLNEE